MARDGTACPALTVAEKSDSGNEAILLLSEPSLSMIRLNFLNPTGRWGSQSRCSRLKEIVEDRQG